MTDAKVVDSIRSLSGEERGEFALFLLSPYFHKGFTVEELKQFYELLLNLAASTEGFNLTKASAHAVIFPEKEYSEGRVDRLMFELNRLIKVFLLTKHYHREENEVQQMLDFAAIQRSKGLATNLEKQLPKLKKSKTGAQSESIENYFSQYLIALEEHEWHSAYNKLKGNVGLPDVLENLDLFYYSQRLEMLNRFLLQQRAISLEIPEVIRLALSAPSAPRFYLEKSPVLLISEKIHAILLKVQPEVSDFEELIALLQHHESNLAPIVLLQTNSYLRNFCTILIDAGKSEFDIVLHQIHRDNLIKGYFYHEGKIHPNAVLNITQHAIRAKNNTWARDFIESHKNKIIGENETRDFYRMNMALCLFAEQKYDEVLDIIPFGSTYSSYHLMARRIELKAYYELNSELLPSKIDAFKMYVSRAGNKVFSQSLSELLTNFGNFVHQLSQSLPGDKKRSEQLIKRIESKKLVGERAWLLEKARALGEK